MLLKTQVSVRLAWHCEKAVRLFSETCNFHDAQLDYVNSDLKNGALFQIRKPRWTFLFESKELDRLTEIRFLLNSPCFASHWGTDNDICSSSIYNFSVSGDEFDLLTGDGGRSGKISVDQSEIEIVTTREILNFIEAA